MHERGHASPQILTSHRHQWVYNTELTQFTPFSALTLLGDMNGIWPVKRPALAIHKGSALEELWGPDLTWSNIMENRPLKQK